MIFEIKVNIIIFILYFSQKKFYKVIMVIVKTFKPKFVSFVDIQFFVRFLLFYFQVVCLNHIFIKRL